MSDNSRTPSARPVAVPAGPSRRKWLVPLIIALVVLIALLLLLSQCGGDDDNTSAGTTTATPTAAATSAAATPGTATDTATATAEDGAGTVTAGGASLLGAGGAQNLSANDGKQATGQGVKVQSVPADEGFWVGSSEQDRVWVQLTGTNGESYYKVKQDDTVNFSGTVTRAAEGFAAKTGVTAAEGADQLTEQGYYISVPASSVKLSD
ncbi:hypothetical protein [Actinoplanes sp. URMC 104]|uniref:hypothetical protein n=1 Tax=Actinoplanes sp. URMC 104 TaxID=3423409 RepID=UPI003F1CB175